MRARIGLVVGVTAGVVLVALGLVARAFALGSGTPYEERVPRWIEGDDGSVQIYDHDDVLEEAAGDQPRYEVVALDASTSAVYLVDPEFNLRHEVFRGSADDAADYATGDADFQFRLESIDASTDVLYRSDELRDLQVELFRGPPDEVPPWGEQLVLVLAFEGTRAEAEAWVDTQPEFDPNVDVPNIIVGAGVVALLAGLSLAWLGSPRRLAYALLGGGVGLIPGAVMRLLFEASVLGEGPADWGASSNSVGLLGALVGLTFGATLGDRVDRSDREPPLTLNGDPAAVAAAAHKAEARSTSRSALP